MCEVFLFEDCKMGWSIGEQKHLGSLRFVGYSVPAYCDQEGCNNRITRGVDNQCDDCKSFFCYDCLSRHAPVKLEIDEDWKDEFVNADNGCRHTVVEKPEHPIFLEHVLTTPSWELWRNKQYNMADKYRKQLRDFVLSKTFNVGNMDIVHDVDGDTSLSMSFGGLDLKVDIGKDDLLELYNISRTILISRNMLSFEEE